MENPRARRVGCSQGDEKKGLACGGESPVDVVGGGKHSDNEMETVEMV